MQLETGIWLEGAYYIDINPNGELRIVGPSNHLLMGSALAGDGIKVSQVEAVADEVALHVTVTVPDNFIPDPAMGHIRRVRELTQRIGEPETPFAQVHRQHPGELAPNHITSETSPQGPVVTYARRFGPQHYGTRWQWPASVSLRRDDNRRGYELSGGSGKIKVTITTTGNVHPPRYLAPLWKSADMNARHAVAQRLLERTAAEIVHLVSNHKTSGFDYGTVFPRDWLESANLLAPELTPGALRFLYAESLRHVTDDGAGWHEDIVGEFRHEREQELGAIKARLGDLVGAESEHTQRFEQVLAQMGELFVTRQMIDIEPHYILGLRLVDPGSFDTDSLVRLRQVARYVMQQADQHRLITFKQVAPAFKRQRGDEYYHAGNWRDSELAFQRIHPVIAPFDVNAVLYPQALRELRHHHRILGLDAAMIDRLITKWDGVKQLYQFTNPDGRAAYALALYDVRDGLTGLRYQQLQVNHLDEAFDHFFADPSQADVVSFATRVLSPDYFRTASGPTLVGHHDGYDITGYHGDVIWTKQAAFAAAGLARQEARATELGWPDEAVELIRRARQDIAATCLHAFTELGAIPELHYDDAGHARLYTDQPNPEGLMNKVQLWSAAGARRLIANLSAEDSL